MTEFQLADNHDLDYHYEEALSWMVDPDHPDHLASLQSFFPHLLVTSHRQLQETLAPGSSLSMLFLPFAVGHNVFFYLLLKGYYPIIVTTNMKKQFQSSDKVKYILGDLSLYSYLIVRYYGSHHGPSSTDEIMLLLNYLFYRFHDLGITSYGRGVGDHLSFRKRYNQCYRILHHDQDAYNHYLISHFPLTVENFHHCEVLLATIVAEWTDRSLPRPEGL